MFEWPYNRHNRLLLTFLGIFYQEIKIKRHDISHFTRESKQLHSKFRIYLFYQKSIKRHKTVVPDSLNKNLLRHHLSFHTL